jgi:hypothetical protein
LLNNVTNMKKFGAERKFIVYFLKVRNKKFSIVEEHTMHGRLKELVVGPLNRGPERWWTMVIIAMAAWDEFVHQEVYNAIVKAFMEEESIVVNQAREKGSAKKGRWSNPLDCSNRLTVPHSILLEKVIHYQNRVSLHCV